MLNQKIRNAVLILAISVFTIAGYFLTRPKAPVAPPVTTAEVTNTATNSPPTATLPVIPKDLNLSKNQLALSEKLQQAQELERSGDIDKAIALYEEVASANLQGEVITGFVVPAQTAAMNLRCLKSRGANYSTSNVEDLKKLVLGALKSGKENKVKYFASCNFYVGEIGAHDTAPLDPDRAVKKFLSIGKTITWQKDLHRLSSFALLTATTQIYQLAFQHIDDRWYWTGFYFAPGAKIY